MAHSPSSEAWNNFVMNSPPRKHKAGGSKCSAAMANMYWGLASNGGINSFLTCSYEYDATDFSRALKAVGAQIAAQQLNVVLRELGTALPSSTQEVRWSLLDRYWSDALDESDVLSAEADIEIKQALERHVRENEAFYKALKQSVQ